jgi:hypothetical protein
MRRHPSIRRVVKWLNGLIAGPNDGWDSSLGSGGEALFRRWGSGYTA